MPDDLWPSNIADSDLVTPITILKEQAALLGDKTRQLVNGEVTTQTTGNHFTHSFYVVAPALGYRFELFRARHGISFYPLQVTWKNQATSLPSEPEFKAKLKEIFSNQYTLNVVQSLIAQLRS